VAKPLREDLEPTSSLLMTGSSIHSKVSHLLSLSLYRQALVLLFDLYVNRTPTKLGSLQRWVRDCDATSQPGQILSAEEAEERNVVLRCLDMVLRVCGGNETNGKGKERLGYELENAQEENSVIKRMKVWSIRQEIAAGLHPDKTRVIQEEKPLWNLIQKGSESE